MPIPSNELSRWSHPYSNEAPKQAHKSIRRALKSYEDWSKGKKYEKILLQGSYKNDTNLRRASDVDIVVTLAEELPLHVAKLGRRHLSQDPDHRLAYEIWKSFREEVIKALMAEYGAEAVTIGGKTLKVDKGTIPAAADVVVALRYGTGIAFYYAKEQRWVVGYPEQHCQRGQAKDKSTDGRYKRTIRMFKSARKYLVDNRAIQKEKAPSYFIECLLHNVPDELFTPDYIETYCGVVKHLAKADLNQFKCQNGVLKLFGQSKEQWNVDDARVFIQALRSLWKRWPKCA